MHNQQEEPHSLQSMSSQEVFDRRDVKKWISLWTPIKLVQDSLSLARTATATRAKYAEFSATGFNVPWDDGRLQK